MAKNPKRPTDFNQRALQIVREAIGEEPKQEPDEKDPAAVKLGAKGGRARAIVLSEEERSEAARLAANARWKRRAPKEEDSD